MTDPHHNEVAALQHDIIDIAHRVTARQKANLQDALTAGAKLQRLQTLLVSERRFRQWLDDEFPKGKTTAYKWKDLAEHADLIANASPPPKSINEAHRLVKAALLEEDEPVPAAANPILQRGDVVVMNQHVLAVGNNCLDFLVDDLRFHADTDVVVVSDPPYGQGKAGVPNDHTGDWRATWDMLNPRGRFVYASPEPHFLRQTWEGIEASGGTVRHLLIEDKGGGHEWAGRLQNRFDVILYFERGDEVWLPGRKACSIIARKDSGKNEPSDHPTPKHVGVISRLIDIVARKGDAVLDPFCGGGTTLIACERMGMRFVGFELEPAYAQAAVERWVKLTGGKPVVHQVAGYGQFEWGEARPELPFGQKR